MSLIKNGNARSRRFLDVSCSAVNYIILVYIGERRSNSGKAGNHSSKLAKIKMCVPLRFDGGTTFVINLKKFVTCMQFA